MRRKPSSFGVQVESLPKFWAENIECQVSPTPLHRTIRQREQTRFSSVQYKYYNDLFCLPDDSGS